MFGGAPGIGWGKPVPVDGRALRYGRQGMALVSAAGPLSNLLLALLAALAIRYVGLGRLAGVPGAGDFLSALIAVNVALCVFNLLPIPPLDGFGVAMGVLPWPLAAPLARLAPYGPLILMLLVFLPFMISIDLLGIILRPPRRLLYELIAWVAGAR